MSRRKRKKKESASASEPSQPKPTYHKSKNGWYYKKSMLPSGKSQCRFCTKAEAEGGLGGSSEPSKKRMISKKQPEAAATDT